MVELSVVISLLLKELILLPLDNIWEDIVTIEEEGSVDLVHDLVIDIETEDDLLQDVMILIIVTVIEEDPMVLVTMIDTNGHVHDHVRLEDRSF